jgi:hypothetical protein
VRSDPLGHHDIRTRIAQRRGPTVRVLEEKRLQRAGGEVRAGKRIRHHVGGLVAGSRRGAEDRPVDLGMPEPYGQRQLTTGRDTAHRGAFCGERDSETRAHPPADILDEERLMGREQLRVDPGEYS